MRTALACVVLAACGGAAAQQQPAPQVQAAGDADPEAYAEVSSYFARRRPAVSQCYADAIGAGKLDSRAKGYVTIAATIPTSGKPENVRIADSTLKSPDVESCIVALVNRWVVPAPGAAIEFSYSYNFVAE